jgi:hypothetical protein
MNDMVKSMLVLMILGMLGAFAVSITYRSATHSGGIVLQTGSVNAPMPQTAPPGGKNGIPPNTEAR